jgi:hypothetical protein
MFVVRWYFLVAVAACSAPPKPAPAPSAAPSQADHLAARLPPPKTGRELIDRVVETYAAITSYQDTGDVISNWVNKPRPDELHFKLFFREPDRVLLEWMDHHPYSPSTLERDWRRNAVWSTGDGAHVNLMGLIEHSEPDAATALLGAAGVSQGVSIVVPGLLVDGMRTPPPTPLDGLVLLPPGIFEDVPCYRVKGHRDEDTFEIWVGQSDFLIRKFVMTPPPGFLDDKLLWTEETHRSIQVDQPIADAVFDDYVPPPNCTGDPFCP